MSVILQVHSPQVHGKSWMQQRALAAYLAMDGLYSGTKNVSPQEMASRRNWVLEAAPHLYFKSGSELDPYLRVLAESDLQRAVEVLTLYFTEEEASTYTLGWEQMAEAAWREMNHYVEEMRSTGQNLPENFSQLLMTHDYMRLGIHPTGSTQRRLLSWAEGQGNVMERLVRADLEASETALEEHFSQVPLGQALKAVESYYRHLRTTYEKLPGTFPALVAQAAVNGHSGVA